MTYTKLIFDTEDVLEIADVNKDGHNIFLTVKAKLKDSQCPVCGVVSSAIHSYYWRKLMDLPILGCQTWIKLKARKFYCKNSDCVRKVFTERFTGHFKSSKRVTARVEERLLEIAYRLGGNAGERICRLLNMPASRQTLIRSIHHQPIKEIVTPRVLGIDDWAYAKRINYGTILVDMERRKIIDLLPDREAKTVEQWLRDHPGVEIVSRDRFSNFANAITQVSTSIIQVADRWHLLHNLTESVGKMLRRNNHYLKEAREEKISEAQTKRDAIKTVRFRQNSILYRKFVEVKALLAKGRKVTHISREVNVDRRTIYKWKKLDDLPRRHIAPRTNIALYETEIKRILSEDPETPIYVIWKKIRQMGYTGGHVTAYKQIGRVAGKKANYIPKLASAFWSPLKASLMLCARPDKLTPKEKQMIRSLCKRSKEIKKTVSLIKDFRLMMENKDGSLLKGWIDRAILSDVKEFSGFARGLLGDFHAVQNALTLAWSNGQVEGQVNKLKTIKRQMYGRASFSLLRKRLIYAGLIQ